MAWLEIVWVASDEDPVPAVCPWRWTKPPSHTQCKPPCAAQVTFHLTLLHFSSGWGSAEEILFPWDKVWLSLASPHWGERLEEEVQAPPSHPVQHLLLSWRENRNRESTPKHLQQQEFTLASLIHISPLEESLQRDPDLMVSLCFSCCWIHAEAQSAQAVMAVKKTAVPQGWHCPSSPCKHWCPPHSLPGAKSCSSKASQH